MSDTLGAFGPACDAVPTEGEGSFAGMADDTAATAASNNPLLSTLVTAVAQADLVDTLNSDGPFTIFAPVNDAFAALPEDQLNAVLADKDLLTSVLTYHVIGGDLNAEELSDGTFTTVKEARSPSAPTARWLTGPTSSAERAGCKRHGAHRRHGASPHQLSRQTVRTSAGT